MVRRLTCNQEKMGSIPISDFGINMTRSCYDCINYDEIYTEDDEYPCCLKNNDMNVLDAEDCVDYE